MKSIVKKKMLIYSSIVLLGIFLAALSSNFIKKSENMKKDNKIFVETALSNQVSEIERGMPQAESDIIEITDDRYYAFVDDVFDYPEEYIKQSYRFRGQYRIRKIDDKIHQYVFQGTDERWVGFEVDYNGTMPKVASVIVVVGKIKIRSVEGKNIPYFHIDSLEVIREGRY
jgi:uncharacterized membrane protein YcgQ (UPF0703/DUF1980 family)